MENQNQIEEEKRRFLEELMAIIILAGGARIEPHILKEKRLGELLDLLYPNKLRLKVFSLREYV